MDTYENKYYEAQKWIESIYSELSHEQQMEAEAFFPALKESEDERVRKAILTGLIDCRDASDLGWSNFGGINIDECIAWLEKQETSYTKRDVDNAYIEGMAFAKNELEKQGNSFIKWNKNTKDNKPQFNHSVLMLTKSGISEGEWRGGNQWLQYRWSSIVKDSDVIGWMELSVLEKQGEQKPIDKIQLGKKYKCIASPRYSTFRRGQIYKPVDNFLCNLMNLCYECFEPIEDSKQKSADKVEPKFKVGDWVISKYMHLVMQILNNDNGSYKTVETDGTERNDSYDFIERNFKLWTIQDAKDGDVLCVKYGNDELPFIFTGKQDDVAYCALNSFGEFVLSIAEWLLKTSVLPATKEQRDTLFAKMKEAGYEWNAEKKEFKKIEQKPQRMISAEAKESLLHDKYEGLTDFERTLADICIGWIGEEIGWKQYIKDNADVLLKIAIKKFNSVQDVPFEQNPAWTKEDESNLQGIIYELQANKSEAPEYDIKIYDKFIDWLKSLKQRIGWKPSDEQMEALYEENQKSDRIKDDRIASLYNDLKKLKGE